MGSSLQRNIVASQWYFFPLPKNVCAPLSHLLRTEGKEWSPSLRKPILTHSLSIKADLLISGNCPKFTQGPSEHKHRKSQLGMRVSSTYFGRLKLRLYAFPHRKEIHNSWKSPESSFSRFFSVSWFPTVLQIPHPLLFDSDFYTGSYQRIPKHFTNYTQVYHHRNAAASGVEHRSYLTAHNHSISMSLIQKKNRSIYSRNIFLMFKV